MGKTTIALLKAATSSASLEAEQRILFLSFSRAAVRQVTDRIRTTLTSAQRSTLEVRTFHSFFLDLCSQPRAAPDRPAGTLHHARARGDHSGRLRWRR